MTAYLNKGTEEASNNDNDATPLRQDSTTSSDEETAVPEPEVTQPVPPASATEELSPQPLTEEHSPLPSNTKPSPSPTSFKQASGVTARSDKNNKTSKTSEDKKRPASSPQYSNPEPSVEDGDPKTEHSVDGGNVNHPVMDPVPSPPFQTRSDQDPFVDERISGTQDSSHEISGPKTGTPKPVTKSPDRDAKSPKSPDAKSPDQNTTPRSPDSTQTNTGPRTTFSDVITRAGSAVTQSGKRTASFLKQKRGWGGALSQLNRSFTNELRGRNNNKSDSFLYESLPNGGSSTASTASPVANTHPPNWASSVGSNGASSPGSSSDVSELTSPGTPARTGDNDVRNSDTFKKLERHAKSLGRIVDKAFTKVSSGNSSNSESSLPRASSSRPRDLNSDMEQIAKTPDSVCRSGEDYKVSAIDGSNEQRAVNSDDGVSSAAVSTIVEHDNGVALADSPTIAGLQDEQRNMGCPFY